MKYSNQWINSIVFITLFVLQQIVAFTYLPFNLVTPYWIVMVLVFVIVGGTLSTKGKFKKDALRFALICAVFSILTIGNGSGIGVVITRVLYMLFGYWGVCYLNEKRIKLVAFELLLIVLYFIFYRLYFQYDIVTRTMMDEDLFGHASSNTIAMTLNIVTYIYLLVSRVYKADNKIRLITYSGVNLFLIVLQGSRAGMLVALMILLISIFSTYKIRSKTRTILLIVFFLGIIAYFVLRNMSIVEEFLSLSKISANSYEEDVRSWALAAFFTKMDPTHFFIGYNPDYEFVDGITRTFNAFVDFWKVYGLLPFAYMLFLTIKRVIKYRDYDIPVIMLLPFFAYSMFESLWGGSFWDILLFMILFYSRKDENVLKKMDSLPQKAA